MNINYELYRVFYYVANLGNITLASNKLNISQPAVSKAIKNLEEALGGQLFIRSRRGVKLTSEGEEFYYYIKEAMEFIKSAENKFNDLASLEVGVIKIGINTTLTREFLSPYLKIFHDKYPKIDIKIITGITSELIRQLKNGLIDILILNVTAKTSFKDIEITKVKKIQDCFVVGSKYFNLLDKKLSLKDLNNYPLILQNNGTNARDFLNDVTSKYDVVLNPNMELASFSLVVEFTKIGYGIGYVTKEFVKKDLENKELAELKIKEAIPNRYIGFAISQKHLPNFATRKLIEIIGNNNI